MKGHNCDICDHPVYKKYRPLDLKKITIEDVCEECLCKIVKLLMEFKKKERGKNERGKNERGKNEITK
jgi:hypothetical protein